MEKTKIIVTIIIILIFIGGLFIIKTRKHAYEPPLQPNISYQNIETIQYKSITNTDPNLLSLDIYSPENTNEKNPTIIYVHGGGWIMGDKANNMDYKPNYFNSLGMVFVSVNYRLTAENNDITYPIHNEDVASAISFLIKNSEKYKIDMENIILIGHSAGAGIVSAISTNDKYLETNNLTLSNIKCTISIDSEGYDIYNIQEELRSAVFGNDELLWQEASPINYIQTGKEIPNFYVITRGNQKRINNAQEFHEKLLESKLYSEILVVKSLDHAQVNDIVGNPKDKIVTTKLTTFINDKCL